MQAPSVPYLEPYTLASWLRGPEREGLVVLDVRDEDYVEGGHILGAHNAPSSSLDSQAALDTLIDQTLLPAKQVVVHCMFSQQRGPRTALRLAKRMAERGVPGPAVLVLRGGFAGFGRLYASEKDLVVASAPE